MDYQELKNREHVFGAYSDALESNKKYQKIVKREEDAVLVAFSGAYYKNYIGFRSAISKLDLMAKDDKGQTLAEIIIPYTLENDFDKGLEAILAKNIDFKTEVKNNQTLEHLVLEQVIKFAPHEIDLLADKGINFNLKYPDGKNAVIINTEVNGEHRPEMALNINKFLKSKGVYVAKKDDQGVQALGYLKGNSPELAEWLIKNLNNINGKTPYRDTILKSSLENNTEYAGWLLKKGADVNAKTSSGSSLLEASLELVGKRNDGMPEKAINLLLQHSAKFDEATYEKHKETFKDILQDEAGKRAIEKLNKDGASYNSYKALLSNSSSMIQQALR